MKIWRAAKRDNTAEENEDAAISNHPMYAIADGATEAYFSRVWAQELVRSLVEVGADTYWSDPAKDFWLAVSLASSKWQQQVPLQPLAWYAQYKAQQGSGATVALLIINEHRQCWRGIAIGDSIIVQVRAGQRKLAWPLSHSSQFNATPHLVGTRATEDRDDVPIYDGDFQPGDRFFLMTDALAAWSLRCEEEGQGLWEDLFAITSPDEWEQFVMAARTQGMRNDDVTLLTLEGVGHDQAVSSSGSISRGDAKSADDSERFNTKDGNG